MFETQWCQARAHWRTDGVERDLLYFLMKEGSALVPVMVVRKRPEERLKPKLSAVYTHWIYIWSQGLKSYFL
ncbi:hypothetical protein TNCV_3918881 [Trichonephila clavipes]|nr:hypothetical protein TNCV_3918881 [Trichonephila clavipes]